MRICLICVELFAWGKYGGFGRAARTIGRELSRRGAEVFAVVPRRPGQAPVEHLDGITVLGFPAWRPWTALGLFRRCNADVYHSCEPSLGTWLAQRAMPHKRHMVTSRDPRDLNDWKLELDRPSLSRAQVALNFLYEGNPLVHRAMRRADAVYTIARDLVPKVKRLYGLERMPEFLPTPIPVPEGITTKAGDPTVCYVARLDRRKRPELFFELARRHPGVRFVAAGRSRDRRYEKRLRERYGALENVEISGFVDQFSSDRHASTLSGSWILVNSATRESMPNSILEASAHGCALLSHVNPDGFATRFGYHAEHDDFERGLSYLLTRGRWRERGRRAAQHVREVFGMPRAMDLHVEAYRRLVDDRRAA